MGPAEVDLALIDLQRYPHGWLATGNRRRQLGPQVAANGSTRSGGEIGAEALLLRIVRCVAIPHSLLRERIHDEDRRSRLVPCEASAEQLGSPCRGILIDQRQGQAVAVSAPPVPARVLLASLGEGLSHSGANEALLRQPAVDATRPIDDSPESAERVCGGLPEPEGAPTSTVIPGDTELENQVLVVARLIGCCRPQVHGTIETGRATVDHLEDLYVTMIEIVEPDSTSATEEQAQRIRGAAAESAEMHLEEWLGALLAGIPRVLRHLTDHQLRG